MMSRELLWAYLCGCESMILHLIVIMMMQMTECITCQFDLLSSLTGANTPHGQLLSTAHWSMLRWPLLVAVDLVHLSHGHHPQAAFIHVGAGKQLSMLALFLT
jgi:hypothetical protein